MNETLFNLKGRRALVTGSSRGIGQAIALSLAEAGADVAIHYAARPDAAQETARLAEAFGGRYPLVQGELGAENAAKSVAEQAVSALGGIDILVLNASIQIPKNWLEITPEEAQAQYDVNFRSSLELLQALAPAMLEQGWGRIVTIGSVQEKKPNPDMLVYSALKSAQTAMGLSLAKQFAPYGVTVNNIAPGVIETDRYRGRVTSPEIAEKVLNWIPMRSLGQARDCAGAALLLCSEAGRYITGQNIFVDGGMSL